MIYILAGTLILLFFMSYFWGGQDFFAPMTIQAMSFVFSALMCIYYMWSFDAQYHFHLNSAAIIISCIALSVGIGILTHHIFIKIRIRSKTQAEIDVSPISGRTSIVILMFTMLVAAWQLWEIRRIGGTASTFIKSMFTFHSIRYWSTTGEYDLPFLLRQLIILVRAVFVLYGFDLIRFYRILPFDEKIIHVAIIGSCILNELLGGGRSRTVNHLIACSVLFHLLRIQKKNGYKKYSVRFLIRMIGLVCAFLWSFAAIKTFVGRDQHLLSNPIDYVSYYTGTEFITFDMYLQNPPPSSSIVGKETFYDLNQNLRNYGVFDIPRYVVHLEFRSVGGGQKTNVYTLFRSYHYDFGIGGVYIFHTIASVFMSGFYEYIKKRRGNLGIIAFSLMYYSIVLSFFAERFFSTIVSVTFLKELFPLLLLYELLIRKRIRFIVADKLN